VRRFSRYLLLLPLLIFSISIANAQSAFDFNIGFGAIQDSAASGQLNQALLPCSGPNDIYGPCVSTPSLSGFMLGFGGDLMLWKSFGVGAEISLQPAKQNYVNLNASAASNGLTTQSLQTRMTLYDFDGIFQPVNTKKVSLKIKGGIGGANLKFYESGSASNALFNQNFSQYFASSNHFQIHGGLGVQIYVTEHVFLRPEFNVHWVRNLTEFGRETVVEELVWLGYSWGGGH
jgi:Outer membrane protein beta-barrel domain